jgi:ketosteroid isomerase-like protein
VATTPGENVALVEELTAAFEAGDEETIDAILADDVSHELDRYGLPHDPASNEDEIGHAAMQDQVYPGSVTTVEETIAVGDKVVAHQTLTIDEHLITGESIVLEETLEVDMVIIYTFECGEVVRLHGVVDELGLLTGLGIIAPIGGEATPAP